MFSLRLLFKYLYSKLCICKQAIASTTDARLHLIELNKDKELFIFPSVEQCVSCVQVCLDLTGFYIPIYLVRLDERDSRLVILAGEAIEITIEPNGEWGFLE
jgi:hypothetical protein